MLVFWVGTDSCLFVNQHLNTHAELFFLLLFTCKQECFNLSRWSPGSTEVIGKISINFSGARISPSLFIVQIIIVQNICLVTSMETRCFLFLFLLFPPSLCPLLCEKGSEPVFHVHSTYLLSSVEVLGAHPKMQNWAQY